MSLVESSSATILLEDPELKTFGTLKPHFAEKFCTCARVEPRWMYVKVFQPAFLQSSETHHGTLADCGECLEVANDMADERPRIALCMQIWQIRHCRARRDEYVGDFRGIALGSAANDCGHARKL